MGQSIDYGEDKKKKKMGKLIAMIPNEPGLISYLPHVGHFEQSGRAIILNKSELVELIQCTEHIELRSRLA